LKILNSSDWRTITLELLIVFVGLLAALQVDQWREERSDHAAETRYLTRLGEDLDASISVSSDLLEILERHHEGVKHVGDSLSTGEILNGNTRLFEIGLIYVSHLPAVPFQSSAYDEMVASGMFARLHSVRLKRVVSKLYATRDLVNRNFSWWRNEAGRLSDQLFYRVSFYSEGQQRSNNPLLINEPLRRARFDFDDLRADTYIRNHYYWATDTHSDWVLWTSTLVELAREARAELDEVMSKRQS